MPEARIRVLHILGTGRPGGVETFVANTVRAVDRSRFEIAVCIAGEDGSMANEIRALGASVAVLSAKGRLHPAAAYRLVRLIATGHFEIIHLHIGGRLLQYLVRRASHGVLIAHLHGPPVEHLDALRAQEPVPPSVMRKVLFSRPDRLLTCSKEIAAVLMDAAPEMTGRIGVLPYGVDTSRFQPTAPSSHEALAVRRQIGLDEANFVAGFVGRLVPQKGIGYLVTAAEQLAATLPAFRLVVIGNGPLRHQLQSLADRLGRDRVILMGERTDVEHWLPACDVLLLTSRWESFGIVLLEAMASARPVVGFAIDSVPDVVAHGETGLLVNPADPLGLAAAVVKLASDPERRHRMGAAGRALVERRFTIQQVARRLEQEYVAVLNHRIAVKGYGGEHY